MTTFVSPSRSAISASEKPCFPSSDPRRFRSPCGEKVLAKQARAKKLGLWRVCPWTVYDPYRGIETRR